ncbi:MAG TPA: iron-sulfur cluster biosynthesis family protein [Elusimicrobiales bacterium]|nr:iron-sulfur cluster biosynthesis family protein [Elusimicrobiales bacterium]
MLEITDGAVEKLKTMINEEKAGGCLRVFMTGGCCGQTVAMDITDKPEKGDVEIEKNGLKVYLNQEAVVKLENATLDSDKAGGVIIKGLPEGGCCG